MDAMGNKTRIDYGTGHELSFIAFLSIFYKIEYLHSKPDSGESDILSDLTATGLVLFPAYLSLVRNLQAYFCMEPAGSHGVWSLDDFQFVPFIWGSSQLLNHRMYFPTDIPEKGIASKEKDSYMFFGCINYIYQVKTGPFAEHSSILYGLTEVPHWAKVNGGMLKMYRAEVLSKFPVMQHFKFGQHLTMQPAPTTSTTS